MKILNNKKEQLNCRFQTSGIHHCAPRHKKEVDSFFLNFKAIYYWNKKLYEARFGLIVHN